jgi:hypothetical protein
MSCPIVMIHRGSADYLKLALRQAKLFNENIILLGDKSNEHFGQMFTFEYIENLENQNVKQFEQVYKHMSTNNYRFELMCFERWFILLEYMKRENLAIAIHLDSDVMVYNTLNEIAGSFLTKYQACYHIPEQLYEENRWIAVPHFSFWTRECLGQFCNFMLDQYSSKIAELKEKWKWHQDTSRRGGICDMTLLYLFYRKNSNIIGNLAPVADDINYCFDLNLNTGDNYYKNEYSVRKSLFFNLIKKINFINGQPFCYNLKLNKSLALYDIHCQGKSKILMYKYFSGEKSARDLIDYLKFAGPFLWKRFVELIRYKFFGKQ